MLAYCDVMLPEAAIIDVASKPESRDENGIPLLHVEINDTGMLRSGGTCIAMLVLYSRSLRSGSGPGIKTVDVHNSSGHSTSNGQWPQLWQNAYRWAPKPPENYIPCTC